MKLIELHPPFSPQMHADFLFPMQLMISDTVLLLGSNNFLTQQWLPVIDSLKIFHYVSRCPEENEACVDMEDSWFPPGISISMSSLPHCDPFGILSLIWSCRNDVDQPKMDASSLQPLNMFTGIGSTVLSLPTYSDTGIDQWADQNDGIELHLYSQDPAFQQKGTD